MNPLEQWFIIYVVILVLGGVIIGWLRYYVLNIILILTCITLILTFIGFQETGELDLKLTAMFVYDMLKDIWHWELIPITFGFILFTLLKKS